MIRKIKKGLVNILKDIRDWPVYGNDVIESLNKPCFMLKGKLLNIDVESRNIINESYYIEITVLQKTRNEIEAYEIFEDLMKKFGNGATLSIYIDNKHINLNSVSYDFIGDNDNIMQIEMEINLRSIKQKTYIEPVIEEVKIESEE